jgi:hypothetical protein
MQFFSPNRPMLKGKSCIKDIIGLTQSGQKISNYRSLWIYVFSLWSCKVITLLVDNTKWMK